MKKYLLAIILLSFSVAKSQDDSTAAQKFSLQEAKDYALIHAWSLQQSELEIEKAKLKVKEALSALLPQVNGQIGYKHFGELYTSIIPSGSFPGQPIDLEVQFGVKENFDVNFTATQTVFNGVFLVGMKAAKTFVEIEKSKKEITADEVEDQVTRAYYNALIAKENAAIIAQNIKKVEEILKTTTALYNSGVVEVIDVDRLKLSLANLKTQVSTLQKQYELTLYVLKYQMGYPIDEPINLTQTLEDFVNNIHASEIGDEIPFMQRKDYALMDKRESINMSNIKRYKAEYMPSIMAYGSMGALGLSQKFNFFGKDPWYPYRFAGFQLNIPIWNSFGTKARVQSAQVDLERIKLGRQQLESAITLEYTKAKTDYLNAVEELNNAKSNMELAEKIYKITQVKYKEGVGSSLELTNAEQQVYTTQAILLSAKYKVLIAKTDIDKALGNY
jgi:outer membrane protein TolC